MDYKALAEAYTCLEDERLVPARNRGLLVHILIDDLECFVYNDYEDYVMNSGVLEQLADDDVKLTNWEFYYFLGDKLAREVVREFPKQVPNLIAYVGSL